MNTAPPTVCAFELDLFADFFCVRIFLTAKWRHLILRAALGLTTYGVCSGSWRKQVWWSKGRMGYGSRVGWHSLGDSGTNVWANAQFPATAEGSQAHG